MSVVAKRLDGLIATWYGGGIGLGPGDFMLAGDPAPPQRKGHSPPPSFRPCGQTAAAGMDEDATWYVGRSRPRSIVLDGHPAPLRTKGAEQPSVFGPRSPMMAHLSYC